MPELPRALTWRDGIRRVSTSQASGLAQRMNWSLLFAQGFLEGAKDRRAKLKPAAHINPNSDYGRGYARGYSNPVIPSLPRASGGPVSALRSEAARRAWKTMRERGRTPRRH